MDSCFEVLSLHFDCHHLRFLDPEVTDEREPREVDLPLLNVFHLLKHNSTCQTALCIDWLQLFSCRTLSQKVELFSTFFFWHRNAETASVVVKCGCCQFTYRLQATHRRLLFTALWCLHSVNGRKWAKNMKDSQGIY